MEVHVFVLCDIFPRVEPGLAATFLTVTDLKTRARTQTNQSLARSIPIAVDWLHETIPSLPLASHEPVFILSSLLGLVLVSRPGFLVNPSHLPPTRLPSFLGSSATRFPTHFTNSSARYSSATSTAIQNRIVCSRLSPMPAASVQRINTTRPLV